MWHKEQEENIRSHRISQMPMNLLHWSLAIGFNKLDDVRFTSFLWQVITWLCNAPQAAHYLPAAKTARLTFYRGSLIESLRAIWLPWQNEIIPASRPLASHWPLTESARPLIGPELAAKLSAAGGGWCQDKREVSCYFLLSGERRRQLEPEDF